jgi:hypothetical protein
VSGKEVSFGRLSVKLSILAVFLFAVRLCPAADSTSTNAPLAADTPKAAPKEKSLVEEIKKPTGWLEWGFDLRLRNEFTHNVTGLDSDAPNNDSEYIRIRPRIWAYLTPVEQFRADLRLISEPRYYFEPATQEGWTYQEGLLDLCDVQFIKPFDLPLTIKAGRQEINFGNKWLIWEGSAKDGSRTEFFDAVRTTLEAKEIATTFDLIYLNLAEETDAHLPVINDTGRAINDQNEQAGILYVRNQSLPNTLLDGYAIYRHEEGNLSSSNEGDTWLVGARIETTFAKRWNFRVEGAPEWGTLNGADMHAWGLNSMLTYTIGGPWKHKVRAGYEYLTGDDPNTADNEGWDPMWARRAQYSELMVQMFGAENRGRSGDFKNLQRPSIGWAATPIKKLDITADYMPMFANENTLAGTSGYSDDGKFRGHLFEAIARVTFNAHWSGHLWTEFFLPGDYYSPQRDDLAVFCRLEMTYRF